MATPNVSVSTHEPAAEAGTPPAQEGAQRFPVEPLIEHLGPNWASEARERGMDPVTVGSLLRSLNRARVSGGLTTRAADRLAILAAGVHPAAIWGAAWWVAVDCGGPGVCTAADCCETPPAQDRDRTCD